MKKIVNFIVLISLSLLMTSCVGAVKLAVDATTAIKNRATSIEEISILPGKESLLTEAKTFAVRMPNQGHKNLMIQQLSARGITINENGDITIEGEVVKGKGGVESIYFRFIAKNGDTVGTATFVFHESRKDASDKIADAIVAATKERPAETSDKGLAMAK